MFKALIASCTVFLLICSSGCSTISTSVPQEAASRIKRVSVISVLAEEASTQKIGMTVFNNSREVKNISDWGIDSLIEAQVTKEIEGQGRLTVVSVPYTRADFLHAQDLNGPWDAPAFRGTNWGAIKEATKKHCADNAIDGIVLVNRRSTGDFLGGSNAELRGIGYYVRSGGMNNVSQFHVLAEVGLLDCRSEQPLAALALSTQQSGWSMSAKDSVPAKAVPTTQARYPLRSYTEERIAELKKNFESVTQPAWGPTLKALFGTQ